MKHFLTVTAIVLCLSSLFSSFCSAETTEPIISSDGKYKYIIDETSGEAFFVGSNETDITVLNIPDGIDGKKVMSIAGCELDTSCLVKINYPVTVKQVNCEFPNLCTKKETRVPLCNLNFSNNLQKLDVVPSFAKDFNLQYYYGLNSLLKYDLYGIEKKLNLITIPETTIEIGTYAVSYNNVKNIVIQGNPNAKSKPFYDRESYGESDLPSLNGSYGTNIYFSNDATNIDPATFDIFIFTGAVNDENSHDIYGYNITNPNVIIYKKPESKGFEKFEEAGYTVKEYTDEWWKNIKEIQSVELTGKGIAESKNSSAKGTVTNLGWSASNDPLQYLSHEYELKMKPGESVTLQASFAPANAFDNRLFFVSLNEDIATVDIESGEIKAVKSGTATIRCVAASGVYSDCAVTVSDAGNSSIIEKIKSNPVFAAVCSGVAAVVAFFAWLISHIAVRFKK